MKHWILGLVFMFIAILCGYEFGLEIMRPEKNWLKIGFFGIICIVASIFYFKERVKRSAYFKERSNREQEKIKATQEQLLFYILVYLLQSVYGSVFG